MHPLIAISLQRILEDRIVYSTYNKGSEKPLKLWLSGGQRMAIVPFSSVCEFPPNSCQLNSNRCESQTNFLLSFHLLQQRLAEDLEFVFYNVKHIN